MLMFDVTVLEGLRYRKAMCLTEFVEVVLRLIQYDPDRVIGVTVVGIEMFK